MSAGSSRSTARLSMDMLEVNYLTLQLGEPIDIKHKRKRDSDENGRQVCEEQLKTITLDELSRHDGHDDCWVAIYDRVYDCTEFIHKHPGGQDIILEYAGRDATLAFVGAGHTASATAILKNYLIGQLPPHERLFVMSNSIKIVTRNG